MADDISMVKNGFCMGPLILGEAIRDGDDVGHCAKFTAEVLFAVTVPVSAIEGAVRGILGLGVFVASPCLREQRASRAYEATFGGCVTSWIVTSKACCNLWNNYAKAKLD